jgi:Acyl-CoA dehydrogenase, N-terminal domain
VPNQQRWEQERNVGRQAWLAAGKQSIIGLPIPERFGGPGTGDFRYRCSPWPRSRTPRSSWPRR